MSSEHNMQEGGSRSREAAPEQFKSPDLTIEPADGNSETPVMFPPHGVYYDGPTGK